MPETNGQPTTEWRESHPVVRASISIDAATLVPAVSADWIALRSRNGHGHVTFHGGHQAIREMLRAALAALPEEA